MQQCKYVFAYENGSWGQQAKLTADTGTSGDQFGFFVGLSGSYAVIGAPQDDDAGSNAGSAYTFVASGGGGGGLQTTTIVYSYDPLYRLTNASYTGALSGTYSYSYDAVGNRLSFSTNVTNTQTVTYTYDAANRLVESVDLTSNDVTTYAWDNANRLITTTVNGQIGRLYSYSQDGDLLQAVVDGVTTTFAYDGDGNRLQMSVDGVTTTYTLDYAADFQPLLETGGSSFTSKHYLYGVACIAEIVDEGRPEEATRYYHRDGSGLVRQTTNQSEAVTYAWTYSPEGAVILGPEGPVTRLDCGDNAIYDWSTGLIFRNGSYFDPNTGIWITLGGMVVWDGWQYGRKWQGKRKRKKRLFLFLFGLIIILALAGCVTGKSTPTTPCPTQTVASSTIYKPGYRPGERTGDLPQSAIGIKFTDKTGYTPPIHRGTAIGKNVFLTSDHWTRPVDISDIKSWEMVDVKSGTPLNPPIRGKGTDIVHRQINGKYSIVVFQETRGTLTTISQLGDATNLKINERLEQAVVIGATPGRYLVEFTEWNLQGTEIRVNPDKTVGGDSGMGLFKGNRIYGVNVGGNGWYGPVNPTEINRTVNSLKATLPLLTPTPLFPTPTPPYT